MLSATREGAAAAAALCAKLLPTPGDVLCAGSARAGQHAAAPAQPRVVIGTPGRVLEVLRAAVQTVHADPEGTSPPADQPNSPPPGARLGPHCRLLCVDDADEVFRNGFSASVRQLVSSLPVGCVVLLLTTSPPDPLQLSLTRNPFVVSDKPVANFFAERRLFYAVAAQDENRSETAAALLGTEAVPLPCVVFADHQRRVAELTLCMLRRGHIVCAIHERMSCREREANLDVFLRSSAGVLCITYLCMRGALDLTRVRTTLHVDFADPGTFAHCLTHRWPPQGGDCGEEASPPPHGARRSVFIGGPIATAPEWATLCRYFHPDPPQCIPAPR